MPRIESGTERERGVGAKGTLHLQYVGVAEQLIEAKEGRPAAVRVQFLSEAAEPISMGVPLTIAARSRLQPFVTVPEMVPTSQEGLTALIDRLFQKDVWWWVECYNGWVSNIDPKDHSTMPKVHCEPGPHRGYLYDMHRFTRADGASRVAFELLDTNSRWASFTCPWPKDLLCEKGDTQEDDYIGPTSALNSEVTMWRYLCQLGLDWQRFIGELEEASVLYSQLGLDGTIAGYFNDPEDITPELVAAVHQHGPQMVQWEMVITSDYGLGIQRTATHQIELLPVIVDGDDFKRDTMKMLQTWDKVASVILGKPVKMTNENGGITDDGKVIVNGLWRPIVNAYPAVTTATRTDGLPGMNFPITAAKWSTGGIVCLRWLAERLVAIVPPDDLQNPGGLCILHGNTAIAKWVAEEVPEFGHIESKSEKEEEEL